MNTLAAVHLLFDVVQRETLKIADLMLNLGCLVDELAACVYRMSSDLRKAGRLVYQMQPWLHERRSWYTFVFSDVCIDSILYRCEICTLCMASDAVFASGFKNCFRYYVFAALG